jgi:hypothetical protein
LTVEKVAHKLGLLQLLKKRPPNNCPTGENSPDLVTLLGMPLLSSGAPLTPPV